MSSLLGPERYSLKDITKKWKKDFGRIVDRQDILDLLAKNHLTMYVKHGSWKYEIWTPKIDYKEHKYTSDYGLYTLAEKGIVNVENFKISDSKTPCVDG